MATVLAPKQWSLTKTGTIPSFESWRQNLVYTLNLDSNYTQFLVSRVHWEKKTMQSPTVVFKMMLKLYKRPVARRRRTKEQKVTLLEMFLGQIPNYAPIISRNTIVKKTVSGNLFLPSFLPSFLLGTRQDSTDLLAVLILLI